MAAPSLLRNLPNPASAADRPAAPGARWPSLVAASLGIEAPRLATFSTLMARHGFAFDASRLFFDPCYAYKRLALAHTSDDADLKALAVEMIERYKALERRRRSVSAFDRPH